jgi:hypothetical protein
LVRKLIAWFIENPDASFEAPALGLDHHPAQPQDGLE